MRDLGTAPMAMDAMAVEKKVMAQVGKKGEEVVNPSRKSSRKFCRLEVLLHQKGDKLTEIYLGQRSGYLKNKKRVL